MHFRTILFAFVLGLLFLLPTSAQIPANKLFAYSNGDIWTWFIGGNPEQITTWGYNGGPVLAPDERFIAYLSLSTESVDELLAGQSNSVLGGTPPTNIWLMDTATTLAEKIAEQDNYPTLRGIPAWSPSGRELAWMEFIQGVESGEMRLVSYDLDTRQTRILAHNLNLGYQDAGIYVPAVQWGAQGISRLLNTFAENGQLQFILELYNPESGALSQYLLATDGDMNTVTSDFPIDYVWVTHQGQSMIATLNADGTWHLLDLQSETQYALNRAPSLMNKNSSASITPIWVQHDNSWEIHWHANDGTIAVDLPFVNYSISQGTPALAPDGSAVAWNNNGDLSYLMLNGLNQSLILDSPETSTFAQPSNIVWSAMTWVTKAATGEALPTPILTGGDACNLPSRLQLGDTVTVSAGEPNNVRRDARLNSPVVAQFASGILAQVTDGPVCVDGFRWWYVSNELFSGWTAEGNAGEYWLEQR